MSKSTSLLNLDDTKAGMQGIDAEKINAIITEASKNSKFHARQLRRQEEVKSRIAKRLEKIKSFSEDEIRLAETEADKILSRLDEHFDTSHTIVHIDLDAFYAAVEILDNPSLLNVPMAVGSLSMLSTSNYEARKYGVRAAMPGFIAKKLCPDLIIIKPNFKKYKEASSKIMNIISLYDDNYFTYGLDEAYLDITEHLKKRKYEEESARTFRSDYAGDTNTYVTFGFDAVECVKEIRHRIYISTGLTASAGVACNRRLAKLCSDVNKPNGQFFLESDKKSIRKFIKDLEVKKIKGIGRVSSAILEGIGIKKCSDILAKRGILYLTEYPYFFNFLMEVSIGYGSSQVETYEEDNQKSIGHETTFKSTNNFELLQAFCSELAADVEKSLKKANKLARKLILKIKTAEFFIFSRSKTLKKPSDSAAVFHTYAVKILKEELDRLRWPHLRLIGIRATDFRTETNSLDNFFTIADTKIPTIVDDIEKESSTTCTPSMIEHPSLDSQMLHSDKNQIGSCPICEKQIEVSDNKLLNEHIDECLTKAAILTEKTPQNVRKQARKSSSSSKESVRSKIIKNNHTIDQFLNNVSFNNQNISD